ncbi:Lrp/AsnC family transcriptional regulator [Allomuricauda sp. CP2A]|jgi:Lrp/AsnC family transcriptional regulator for asnA, asnC and gidA|uniref:Lrp/AsnC family transcriptional regulator n=1 Tax=Allomuricauda sp. CP2A TaxID=1848189 RepID=UPI00082AFEEF|nr:Lrp/AsnC family transcriptional regulator [Muricauda sp. CP2A]
MENNNSFDELDFTIMSHLQKDGRASFTVIAKETGASISTIRTRVTKLIEDKTINILGRVNPEKLGFNAYATIKIAVRPANKIDEVANKLMEFREVSFLAITSGDFDLEVNVMCRDNNHLIDVINKRISSIEGVYNSSSIMYLRVLKFAQPDLNLLK